MTIDIPSEQFPLWAGMAICNHDVCIWVGEYHRQFSTPPKQTTRLGTLAASKSVELCRNNHGSWFGSICLCAQLVFLATWEAVSVIMADSLLHLLSRLLHGEIGKDGICRMERGNCTSLICYGAQSWWLARYVRGCFGEFHRQSSITPRGVTQWNKFSARANCEDWIWWISAACIIVMFGWLVQCIGEYDRQSSTVLNSYWMR
jgi:hypothetical protein